MLLRSPTHSQLTADTSYSKRYENIHGPTHTMSGPTPKTPKTPPMPDSLVMWSSSVSDSNSAAPRPNFGSTQCVAPKPPSPPTSRSSAERVVEANCTLQKIADSRLFTDHDDLLPFGLCVQNGSTHQEEVERLLEYSVSLKNFMATSGTQLNEAEGQACFITTHHGIVMATVKHNFCTDFNNDGNVEKCLSATVRTPRSNLYTLPQFPTLTWDARHLKHEDEGAFKFNSNDDKPGAGWKYGKELLLLPLSVPNQDQDLMTDIEQENIRKFEAVSTTFQIKEGMRVGIMACSCFNNLAKSLQNGLRSGNYEAQLGDTFITVGEITHVGNDHIEYSANTVPGFSGAPVFLLMPGDEQDMKLIAIHAGYSEALETNFGFLVAEKVEKYGAEQTCCTAS